MDAKQEYNEIRDKIDYFAMSFDHPMSSILRVDECIDSENTPRSIEYDTNEYWENMVIVSKDRFLMNCEEYGIDQSIF